MSSALRSPGRAFAGLLLLVGGFAGLLVHTGASQAHSRNVGAVYTLSNAAAANQVLAFARGDDGVLSPAGAFDTGGQGNGGSLGSQGAVALSENGRYLVAVNAGSNTVSLFAVRPDGLVRLDVEPAQGSVPVSVTIAGDLVYVVNDGSDNIAGFKIDDRSLRPIAGSVENLPAGSAPGQVGFTENGRALLVTVKNLNLLLTFRLDRNGAAEPAARATSAAATPFGFAIDRRNHAVVSEAPGSDLSSYDIGRNGAIALIDGPVANGQRAACWVALSKDGRFAFSANAGTANISSYALDKDGKLTLLFAVAGSTVGGPQDLAVSNDGRFLYAVSRATNTITEFAINQDGSLTTIGSIADGAMGAANGLVAR